MTEYQNRQELILEILNRSKLFMEEFNDIDEKVTTNIKISTTNSNLRLSNINSNL